MRHSTPMNIKSIQIDGYYDLPESEADGVWRDAMRRAQAIADEHDCIVEIYDNDTMVEAIYPDPDPEYDDAR